MHGAELVDLDISPQDRKAQRWRRVLRVGVPVVSVALLIGAVLGISLYSYESNRRGASMLSDDLLLALEERIATEVATYLAPAPKMAQFARRTLAGGTFDPEGVERAEEFGRNVLRTYEQIASFYVADGKGQFLMILRNDEGGSDTKLITIAPDRTRHVRLYQRNALGQVANERELQDDFDPRMRPWYRGAVETRELYWTDIYVFFTKRAPGITAALPLVADDGSVAAIYGIDITLAALSRFLESIEVGATGRAMIVDADGRLVAFPEPERILRDDGGKLVSRRLDELGDLALTRAFNRLRVEGHSHGIVDVDGERVIFASQALPIADKKKWSVLVVVPEREIIGFLAANNRTSLLMSLSIIGVAILLAGLLIRQGIRADRNARLVGERQQAVEKQTKAFAALADSANVFDPADRRGTPAVTELLAEATGARRISVWHLAHEGRSLLCRDCFDRESGIHTSGIELHRAELQRVWAALHAGDELDVPDAAKDSRTGALHGVYLQPLDIRALMALPIKHGSEVVGSIWLEDLPPPADRAAGIESFARTAASMEAVRIAAPLRSGGAPVAEPAAAGLSGQPVRAGRSEQPEPAWNEPPPDQGAPATPAHRRETAIDIGRQEVLRRRSAGGAETAEVFPAVTILTVLLEEALKPGRSPDPPNRDTADAETELVDTVARVLEDAAPAHEMPFLKVLGDRVVAAAGFSGDPARAAHAVARAALALRGSDKPFTRRLRMGMDTGAALGCAVGRGRDRYNLWGTAVRRAAEMAKSAPLGSIQVTAFAYENLSSEFLFRPRGTFYAYPDGETATYQLAGQI